MTRTYRIPSVRASGGLVSLHSILNAVEGAHYHWRVTEFWGVGRPPAGFPSMPEFEAAARTGDGVSMSWLDLLDFARHQEQTIDAKLEGRLPAGTGPALTIEMIDGDDWDITALEELEPGVVLTLERLGRE